MVLQSSVYGFPVFMALQSWLKCVKVVLGLHGIFYILCSNIVVLNYLLVFG